MIIDRNKHNRYTVDQFYNKPVEDTTASQQTSSSTTIIYTGGSSGSGLTEEQLRKLNSIEDNAQKNQNAFSYLALSDGNNTNTQQATIQTDTANLSIVGQDGITVLLVTNYQIDSTDILSTGNKSTTFNVSYKKQIITIPSEVEGEADKEVVAYPLTLQYVDGDTISTTDITCIQLLDNKSIVKQYYLTSDNVTITQEDSVISSIVIDEQNLYFDTIQFIKTEETDIVVSELHAQVEKYDTIQISNSNKQIWYLDDNGNARTDYNAYSTKEISAYGLGSSSGSEGNIGYLYELKDVDATTAQNPINDGILQYNASTKKWQVIDGSDLNGDKFINKDQIGADNGVAPLTNGKISEKYLPSYVDDVVEYSSKDIFPTTGESGKIYIDTSDNVGYRWTGSRYVAVMTALTLGYTSTQAFPGNEGKEIKELTESMKYVLDMFEWDSTNTATRKIKAKASLWSVGEVSAYGYQDTTTQIASYLYELKDVSETAVPSVTTQVFLVWEGNSWKYVNKDDLSFGVEESSLTEILANYAKKTDIPVVYDWAKAESKPTYNYSEILNTPTSLKNPYSLKFTGYKTASYDGSAEVTIALPTKLSQFTDDVVSGKYLPLTGGTLTGSLTMKQGSATYGGYIYFGDSNVYVAEPTNNNLVIYARDGITLSTSSSSTTGFTLKNGDNSVTLYVDAQGRLKVTGNLYATGEVSAYGVGEGTSVGSASYLYELKDVGETAIPSYNEDTFLVWDASTSSWKYKASSDLTLTDTKNTAGSTNTSEKLYLVGAKTQTTQSVTYSHDTAYVGTDGALYSEGKKVSTSDHTHPDYITDEELENRFITSNTYSNIYNLAATGQLEVGKKYCITDYQCIYKEPTTQSTFTMSLDGWLLILTADTTSTFNENVEVRFSTSSSYVSKGGINIISCKYDINNDTSKYQWAVSSGKGVIYYLEDANNNKLRYDFKHIKFRRYRITNVAANTTTDSSTNGNAAAYRCFGNSTYTSNRTDTRTWIGAGATIEQTLIPNIFSGEYHSSNWSKTAFHDDYITKSHCPWKKANGIEYVAWFRDSNNNSTDSYTGLKSTNAYSTSYPGMVSYTITSSYDDVYTFDYNGNDASNMSLNDYWMVSGVDIGANNYLAPTVQSWSLTNTVFIFDPDLSSCTYGYIFNVTIKRAANNTFILTPGVSTNGSWLTTTTIEYMVSNIIYLKNMSYCNIKLLHYNYMNIRFNYVNISNYVNSNVIFGYYSACNFSQLTYNLFFGNDSYIKLSGSTSISSTPDGTYWYDNTFEEFISYNILSPFQYSYFRPHVNTCTVVQPYNKNVFIHGNFQVNFINNMSWGVIMEYCCCGGIYCPTSIYRTTIKTFALTIIDESGNNKWYKVNESSSQTLPSLNLVDIVSYQLDLRTVVPNLTTTQKTLLSNDTRVILTKNGSTPIVRNYYDLIELNVPVSSISRTANTFLAAPSTGDGVATFRTLTDSDMPSNITATKLGTSTIGSGVKPIYLNTGTATASTSTVGSNTKPIYLSNGTITASSYAFGNASSNIPISNGTLNTNLNADLLDGCHYTNILERNFTGEYNYSANGSTGSSSGAWFRIAKSKRIDSLGIVGTLYIARSYYTYNNEVYKFDISVRFGHNSDSYNNPNVTINKVVSNCATQRITKLRVTGSGSGTYYIDIFIQGLVQDNYYWYTVGQWESLTSWQVNPSMSTYSINANIQTDTAIRYFNTAANSTNRYIEFTKYVMSTNESVGLRFGQSGTTYNNGHIFFVYQGDGSTSNRISIGFYDQNDILNATANGYVGIGVTTPTQKLQVNGNCLITGSYKLSGNGAFMYGNETNYYSRATYGLSFDTSQTNSMFLMLASYYGMTFVTRSTSTTKGYKMQYQYDSSNESMLAFYDTSDVCHLKMRTASTNPWIWLSNNGTNGHYIQNFNGYLYLGSGYTKSFRVDSSGNCLTPGELTAYSSSDINLKTDIKPISSALQLVDNINPISFKWNNTAKQLNTTKDNRTNYGVIAQELKLVLPELTHTIYDKYLSVDYVQLIPILIQAIKELKNKINELASKDNI